MRTSNRTAALLVATLTCAQCRAAGAMRDNRKIVVGTDIYRFSPEGLHAYCNDHVHACEGNPMRALDCGIDSHYYWAIGGYTASLLFAVGAIVAGGNCAHPCNGAQVGVTAGLAGFSLSGLLVGISEHSAGRDDLEAWRKAVHGRLTYSDGDAAK